MSKREQTPVPGTRATRSVLRKRKGLVGVKGQARNEQLRRYQQVPMGKTATQGLKKKLARKSHKKFAPRGKTGKTAPVWTFGLAVLNGSGWNAIARPGAA